MIAITTHKDKVREYFDKTAPIYDVKHGVTLPGQRHNFAHHYEPFLMGAIKPGASVLELGCGTGVYSQWLVDHGCSVVGMDLSPKILEQARGRCRAGTFIEGDCEDPAASLPESYRNERFDVILAVNTFCYYPNKADALARYRNLLRPGGRLVFIEVNGRCPYWRWMTWANKNEIRAWFDEFRRFNNDTLRAMLEPAGFRIQRLTNFAFIPNGIGSTALAILKPLDFVLGRLSITRRFAMRLGLVAEGV